MTFLDCGSHIGYFSKIAKDKGCKVISFDPVHDNKYSDKHYMLGLSNVKKNCTFMRGITTGGGFLGEEGSIIIGIDKLDNLLKSKVDVMKIDVEGEEINLIKGGSKLIKKYHPILFIDVHCWIDNKELYSFLESLGYIIYTVEKNPKLIDTKKYYSEILCINQNI